MIGGSVHVSKRVLSQENAEAGRRAFFRMDRNKSDTAT